MCFSCISHDVNCSIVFFSIGTTLTVLASIMWTDAEYDVYWRYDAFTGVTFLSLTALLRQLQGWALIPWDAWLPAFGGFPLGIHKLTPKLFLKTYQLTSLLSLTFKCSRNTVNICIHVASQHSKNLIAYQMQIFRLNISLISLRFLGSIHMIQKLSQTPMSSVSTLSALRSRKYSKICWGC